MEVFSQDELLEVPGGGGRGPDSLPHFMFAVSKVVGSHPRHESVVPEHIGLQGETPVHDGAHCRHLVDKRLQTLRRDQKEI